PAGLLDADASPKEVVVAYHERTKHHFHRYAASLGYMDWATQPDPFRRYQGADLIRLPPAKPGRPLPYWQLYALGDVSSEPRALRAVSRGFLPRGPLVGALAGSLEVRRARVPLLPARCGARPCNPAHCGGGSWLGLGAPRRDERQSHRCSLRAQPR